MPHDSTQGHLAKLIREKTKMVVARAWWVVWGCIGGGLLSGLRVWVLQDKNVQRSAAFTMCTSALCCAREMPNKRAEFKLGFFTHPQLQLKAEEPCDKGTILTASTFLAGAVGSHCWAALDLASSAVRCVQYGPWGGPGKQGDTWLSLPSVPSLLLSPG